VVEDEVMEVQLASVPLHYDMPTAPLAIDRCYMHKRSSLEGSVDATTTMGNSLPEPHPTTKNNGSNKRNNNNNSPAKTATTITTTTKQQQQQTNNNDNNNNKQKQQQQQQQQHQQQRITQRLSRLTRRWNSST
jgi:hypothetical protein